MRTKADPNTSDSTCRFALRLIVTVIGFMSVVFACTLCFLHATRTGDAKRRIQQHGESLAEVVSLQCSDPMNTNDQEKVRSILNQLVSADTTVVSAEVVDANDVIFAKALRHSHHDRELTERSGDTVVATATIRASIGDVASELGKINLALDARPVNTLVGNQLVVILLGWCLVVAVLAMIVQAMIRASVTLPLARIADWIEESADGAVDRRLDTQSFGAVSGLAANLETMRSASAMSAKRLNEEVVSLRQRHRQLEKDKALSDSANRLKSEFLANMSHELRTPLSAILGFADAFQKADYASGRDASIPIEECVETIRRNGEHLLAVINQILDISKLEAGEIEISKSPCSPIQILEDVYALAKLQAEAKSLQFELDIQTPLPKLISSDALRIKQVLINLTANAVKFTDEGSIRLQAYVSAVTDQPWLRFVVVDTGIGCSEEQLAQVFDRFRQVDGRKRGDGTGLGLAISKGLTKQLGGIIEANSCESLGSEFTVSIPIAPTDLALMQTLDDYREQLTVTSESAAGSVPNSGKSHRVLYAEDGPDNQRLVSYILSNTGYEVVVVNDGVEAIDEIHRARSEDDVDYDLVLMDMQMPRLDGYHATRQLRDEGCTIPIIALTAHAMTDDRKKCLEAGCTEYLSKPIKPATLRELVGDIIAQHAHASIV